MVKFKIKTNSNIIIIEILGFLMALTYARFIPVVSTTDFKIILSAVIATFAVISIVNKRNYGAIFIITMMLFCGVNIVSAVLGNSDNSWIGMQFHIIGTVLFVYLCYQNNTIRPVYVFTCVCNLWVVISFFDVISPVVLGFKPSQILLLCGYDNGLGAYYIPIITLNLFFLLNKRKQVMMVVGVVLATAQVIIIWSATALVGLAFIIGIFLAIKLLKNYKVLSPWIFFAIGWAVFFFIVILRSYDLPIFHFIIEDVLQKSFDFTGRPEVWDRAFLYIARSPIIGSGRNADYQRTLFLGVSSAHNYYLDIMCQSGIVGIVIVIILQINLLLSSRRKIDSDKYFLMDSLFAAIIVMQFESYCGYDGFPLFYLLFTLSKFGGKISWDLPKDNLRFVFGSSKSKNRTVQKQGRPLLHRKA